MPNFDRSIQTHTYDTEYEIEVIRSSKRKKTMQARVTGNKMTIRIPAFVSKKDETRIIREYIERFQKKSPVKKTDETLQKRAEDLATQYNLPFPESVRWVTNQNHRWGSCTPETKHIRITDRMKNYPDWVVDYVLLHELAHLVEANHSPAFYALIEAYEKSERAQGYLLAKSE